MSDPITSQSSTRRFFVRGRVQGVYFRASTREAASKLGLRGFACNLPDGRVEVVSTGNIQALDSLGEWLKIGSPASRVDEVIVEEIGESETLALPDGFETR
jgi:acylphosphatase